jgi:hypothetical protein
MTLEEHTLNLGKLMVNLHSLEFCLRVFLCEAKKELVEFPAHGQIQVSETHLTNYDFLGRLIDSYNTIVSPNAPDLTVDKGVVTLRDAIAHGRVFGQAESPPLRLLKFDQPSKGAVSVTFDALMDQDWFTESRQRVWREVGHVRGAADRFGYSAFR